MVKLKKVVAFFIKGTLRVLEKTFVLYFFILVWVLLKNVLEFVRFFFLDFLPYIYNLFLLKIKAVFVAILAIPFIKSIILYGKTKWQSFEKWLSGEKKYNTSQTEFLPIALEVLEAPPSRTIRVFWLILVMLFAFTLVYISFASTEVIVPSSGKVVSRKKVVGISSVMNGKISEIFVEEGDYVTKGMPLLSMKNDLQYNRAVVQKLKESGQLVEIGALSYLYEMNNPSVKKLSYEEDIISFAQKLAANYALDFSKKTQEIRLLKLKVLALEYKVNLCKDVTIPAYKKIIDDANQKRRENIISKSEYNNIVVAFNKIQIECNEFESQLSSSNVQLKILTNNVVTARQQFDIKKQLSYYKYLNMKKAYLNIMRTNTKYVYYSEVNKAIVGNFEKGENTTVKEGEKILELVPTTEKIIEGQVLNRYSGTIRKGQKVYFKVNAFPYTKFGLIEGILYYIAPNSQNVRNIGSVNKIKVRITKVSPKIKLQVGMDGQIEIRLGKRTLLEYLLTPIKRTINESMREL